MEQEDEHLGRVFDRIIASYFSWEVHKIYSNQKLQKLQHQHYLESVRKFQAVASDEQEMGAGVSGGCCFFVTRII